MIKSNNWVNNVILDIKEINSSKERLFKFQNNSYVEYKTEDEIATDSPELSSVKHAAAVVKEGLQIGSIAQEIQTVLPDLVTETTSGILSVSTDNLVWYLVNAVKELSAEVKALKEVA